MARAMVIRALSRPGQKSRKEKRWVQLLKAGRPAADVHAGEPQSHAAGNSSAFAVAPDHLKHDGRIAEVAVKSKIRILWAITKKTYGQRS